MTQTTADAVPRSIGRVLDVLELVVRSGDSSLTSIAHGTGLTPTTALRHLRALDQRGYVQRVRSGTFQVGPTLLQLAAEVMHTGRPASLVEAAQPILDQLASTTGESAYVAVASGTDALYLATAESRRAIRHVGWAGRAVPLAGSAVGDALAGKPGARVRNGAVEPDITAVAAGVRVNGQVAAAVSVVGPAHRMRGAALTAVKRHVVAAAGRLAESVSARGLVAS